MANKGNSNRQKRISYAGKAKINRKEHCWTFNTKPGAHAKNESVSFGLIIRDVLNLANNTKEVKYILNNKNCFINGVRIKEHRFAVGLFDILFFKDIDKTYRVLLTKKDKIILKEINDKEHLIPCRVKVKKPHLKDKFLIGFSNGYNHIVGKNVKVSVGDSVMYDINKKAFADVVSKKEGARVYIVGGPHVSSFGVLKNIIKGDLKKSSEVTVDCNGKEVKTMEKYIFVIPENLNL
jgi:small subunit ribosomal protein S4e